MINLLTSQERISKMLKHETLAIGILTGFWVWCLISFVIIWYS